MQPRICRRIEESVKNASAGVTIDQDVLQDLSEINAEVHKVAEVMNEIVAASEQQSQGIDQITTAVEQMNSVTQQAAANAEESASASEELAGQSEEMKGTVSSFRLTGWSASGIGFPIRENRPTPRRPAFAVPIGAPAPESGNGGKRRPTTPEALKRATLEFR